MAKKKQPPPLPEGMPRRPRDRKQKSKAPCKPPVIDGTGRLSPGVPNHFKAAIAAAIFAYSNMEMQMEVFIWDVLGLSADDGRLLTQIEMNKKIAIARTLATRHKIAFPVFGPERKTLWTVVSELGPIRNLMVHGIWGMHDLTIPIASSFRLKEEGEIDRVISETFPATRLNAILRQCERLKACLEKMCVEAQELQRMRAEPRSSGAARE